MRKIYRMATTTVAVAESSGQSAWNHAVKTFGDMGQQTAGANGAIAVRMTGGKSRKQSRRHSRKQSKKQSQKGGKRHRQSKKQRGGRR